MFSSVLKNLLPKECANIDIFILIQNNLRAFQKKFESFRKAPSKFPFSDISIVGNEDNVNSR